MYKIHIAKKDGFFYGYVGVPSTDVLYKASYNELFPKLPIHTDKFVKNIILNNKDIPGFAKYEILKDYKEEIISSSTIELNVSKLLPLFSFMPAPYGMNYSGFPFWKKKKKINILKVLKKVNKTELLKKGISISFIESFYKNIFINSKKFINFINSNLPDKEEHINSVQEVISYLLNKDSMILSLIDKTINNYRKNILISFIKRVINYFSKEISNFSFIFLESFNYILDVIKTEKILIDENKEKIKHPLHNKIKECFKNSINYAKEKDKSITLEKEEELLKVIEKIFESHEKHLEKETIKIQKVTDTFKSISSILSEEYLDIIKIEINTLIDFLKEYNYFKNKELQFSIHDIFNIYVEDKSQEDYWYFGFTNEPILPNSTNSKELMTHYLLIHMNKRELIKHCNKLAYNLYKYGNDKRILTEMMHIASLNQDYEKAGKIKNKIEKIK